MIDCTFHWAVTLQGSSAYVLVFHGSRDPRSQRAARQLTTDFRQKIQHSYQVAHAVGHTIDLSWRARESPNPPVHDAEKTDSPGPVWVQDAYLECHPQPLADQIQQWLTLIAQSPHRTWRTCEIIPVFLASGVHVMDDLPAAIASVQANTPRDLRLHITPHLGLHPGLTRLLNERMSALPMEAWILLAHGSRRAGANEQIERVAEALGAVTAYWSTRPSLDTRIQEFADLGLRRIGILPYFLFSGGITDAIAQTVDQLRQLYPALALTLSHPLDANLAELADLLMDWVSPSRSRPWPSIHP